MDDHVITLRAANVRERLELAEVFWPQKQRIWPEFMFHDVYGNRLWRYLAQVFDAYQICLLDEDDQPVAVAQTAPCAWDGTMAGLPVGWADSLVRAVDGYEAREAPNTLVALEIAIKPEQRG